ncbi:hypothetical protein [Harryflintia acetispora]|uniref:Lipoprotein n=1 Tax=Harryflintia acetispora TaxID=1849041 RepID=A0A9X8UJG9_9FIRM|nr:hypothetical protein [Harryflintia acetispora]TCL43492.1 hypothetical protein EDD78_105124 [Harryflintia acetispora]
MIKRIIAALLALSLALSLSACGLGKKREVAPPQAPSSSGEAKEPEVTSPQEDPDTPAGAAKTALDALKELDIETFNRYSDNNRKGGNVIIGDLPEEGPERELIEALVKNLSGTFSREQIDGDRATVSASITNTDLTGVIDELINFAIADALKGGNGDYVAKLVELVQEADGSRTAELELTLERVDGGWKVHIDEKLSDAVCGGMVSSALELADKFGPLGEKLREYVPGLGELD